MGANRSLFFGHVCVDAKNCQSVDTRERDFCRLSRRCAEKSAKSSTSMEGSRCGRSILPTSDKIPSKWGLRERVPQKSQEKALTSWPLFCVSVYRRTLGGTSSRLTAPCTPGDVKSPHVARFFRTPEGCRAKLDPPCGVVPTAFVALCGLEGSSSESATVNDTIVASRSRHRSRRRGCRRRERCIFPKDQTQTIRCIS